MHLRTYWYVVRRRWWLPALMVTLTLVLWLVQPAPPPMYVATMRFLVGVRPEPLTPGVYGYDRYYTWLTSEYLIDDFSEVVRGSAFAGRVSARLQDQGITVPPGAIQGSTQTGKLHRLITISVTWPRPEELEQIAQAVVATVKEDADTFFPQVFSYGTEAILVDGPHVGPVTPGLRERLEGPVRVLLALLIGIGLVFLWHALDDRLYDRDAVQELGLPVLAEVPRSYRGWAVWRRRQQGQGRGS